MTMRRNNEESYHEVVNVTLQNSNRERVQREMEVVIFNAKVRIESEARYNLLQSSTIFDMLHITCYKICYTICYMITIYFTIHHDNLLLSSRCCGGGNNQSVAKVEL